MSEALGPILRTAKRKNGEKRMERNERLYRYLGYRTYRTCGHLCVNGKVNKPEI
jgi:hypothetical protein